jgi:hypothetical protein
MGRAHDRIRIGGEMAKRVGVKAKDIFEWL